MAFFSGLSDEDRRVLVEALKPEAAG